MSKKVYIAIILLVVLIAASAAAIYVSQPPTPTATVGLQAGDTFTYSIQGTSTLSGLGAVDTPGFSQYNNTDAFIITIANVNGSSVSLNTVWRFKNGSEIKGQQTIDLSNGLKSDDKGFWAIYSSNLNVGDKLRPTGFDKLTVNRTDTKTFAGGAREINYMFTEAESFLATDPTRSTLRYDFTGVNFDKQTGMLETLNWVTEYNNPVMTEVITWKLVSSTVWAV